jgi:hypothetical protein
MPQVLERVKAIGHRRLHQAMHHRDRVRPFGPVRKKPCLTAKDASLPGSDMGLPLLGGMRGYLFHDRVSLSGFTSLFGNQERICKGGEIGALKAVDQLDRITYLAI